MNFRDKHSASPIMFVTVTLNFDEADYGLKEKNLLATAVPHKNINHVVFRLHCYNPEMICPSGNHFYFIIFLAVDKNRREFNV